MSGLRRAVDEYLSVRRAVGFRLVQAERLLLDFVAFAEAEGATRVTTDLALRWATRPAQASPGWCKQRTVASAARRENTDAKTDAFPLHIPRHRGRTNHRKALLRRQYILDFANGDSRVVTSLFATPTTRKEVLKSTHQLKKYPHDLYVEPEHFLRRRGTKARVIFPKACGP